MLPENFTGSLVLGWGWNQSYGRWRITGHGLDLCIFSVLWRHFLEANNRDVNSSCSLKLLWVRLHEEFLQSEWLKSSSVLLIWNSNRKEPSDINRSRRVPDFASWDPDGLIKRECLIWIKGEWSKWLSFLISGTRHKCYSRSRHLDGEKERERERERCVCFCVWGHNFECLCLVSGLEQRNVVTSCSFSASVLWFWDNKIITLVF